MRPRVFPAEDDAVTPSPGSGNPGFNEAAGIPRGRPVVHGWWERDNHRASMRPRVFPAEDVGRHADGVCRRVASMRPRVFPAEDEPPVAVPTVPPVASMRPRVFPAEDSP